MNTNDSWEHVDGAGMWTHYAPAQTGLVDRIAAGMAAMIARGYGYSEFFSGVAQ